jgi:hypothetical protein
MCGIISPIPKRIKRYRGLGGGNVVLILEGEVAEADYAGVGHEGRGWTEKSGRGSWWNRSCS